MPSAVEGKKRVQVNFPDSVYEDLETLARRRGKTLADVLRDAIALEKWVDDRVRNGAKLLIREDGETKEVIFR